jgi:nucleotide-binding universal stress UspA family protein
MTHTVVLCTDGSDLASAAALAGSRILGPIDRAIVVTVIDPLDPALAVGGGHAGAVMSPAEVERLDHDRRTAAAAIVADAAAALGRPGVEPMVIEGAAGPAICDLARDVGADAIVLGTRGRGGIRRAVLGSVSDHVVRNAPCPVVTVASPG